MNGTDQCRICLETTDALLNMFDDPSTIYKLKLCCGLEILDQCSLPGKICKTCSIFLNVAYDFRVLCQRSQEYLSAQQTLLDDEEIKPNLADIELEPYNLEKYVEYLQEEPESTINKTNEETENSAESEKSDRADFNDDDDSDTMSPSKVGNLWKNHFKARTPKKPKSPVSYMCNICGNLYKNKGTFTYHMKLHSNERKYECEICNKRFMQTCELGVHMRMHTGEKPFQCSYCERKFRDRSGVMRHERTHTNERPYGCNICGAKFSYSATLKKHTRVHTGEKRFKCVECRKQFTEAHQLKTHLTTIRHKEMVSENSKHLHSF